MSALPDISSSAVSVEDRPAAEASFSSAASPEASSPAASAPAASAPAASAPAASSPARAAAAAPQRLEKRWLAPAPELSLRAIACTLMMVISLVMVVWHLQDDANARDNANTSSRYATIEALVDHGTYSIDDTHYVNTIDKYKAGGHYISSKPPMLSTLAAGVYWGYQQLTGKTIAHSEGPVVRLVGFFTGGLCHLAFLIYFYRLCTLLLRRDIAIIVCMAGACFGYLGVAYATRLNELSTAAALGICGLYHACAISHGRAQRARHWLSAGLVLGLLPAIDLPGLAISGLIGLYLFAYDWRKTLLWFVPALLPGIVSHLALTYHISGSFLPFYFNSDLRFKGFAFHNPGGIDALHEPKATYAFNVLLGHHGLFSMTPLLAFGLWEIVSCLRGRRLVRESLVCGLSVAAFLTFFIWRTHNYGGWCVGMRWLVPVMPLLLLYFGVWLDRVRLSWRWFIPVLGAFAVSVFNVQDGIENPYQYSLWHNWLEGAPLNRNRLGGRTFNVHVKRHRKGR